jgi:hypothetical protein
MPEKAASPGIPPDRIEQYDRLIATEPGLVRRGAKVPYTSLNGHMFSFLSPTGTLALRLPPAERDAFLERYDTVLHVAYDSVMKEYVTVPDAMFADTDTLRPYFAASRAYVAGLEPKPTRRKR